MTNTNIIKQKYGGCIKLHLTPRCLKMVLSDTAKVLVEQAIRTAGAAEGEDNIPHKIEILISKLPSEEGGFTVGWESDFEPAGYTSEENFTNKKQGGEMKPDA